MPEVKGEYAIEDILKVIRERKYLIIIDRCRLLVQKNKEAFNEFLVALVERSQRIKLIVITPNIKDIDTNNFYKGIEIPELNQIDAARLLMKCAKESNHLKDFQNEKEFSKHQIFQVFPLKPQGIVQIAQVLRDKSLQEIVDEKLKLDEQNKIQKEEEKNSSTQNELIDVSN